MANILPRRRRYANWLKLGSLNVTRDLLIPFAWGALLGALLVLAHYVFFGGPA